MSKLGELVGIAKARFNENKRGLYISGTYALSSSLFLIPTQTVLTFGVGEAVKHFGLAPLGIMTYGLIALNVASIAVESLTLARHSFSNNPPSPLLNISIKEGVNMIPDFKKIAEKYPIIPTALISIINYLPNLSKEIVNKHPIVPATLVSTISHLYHLLPVGLLNPYLFSSFSSLLSADKKAFFENFGSISAALAIWNLVSNYTILNGTADRVANKIDQVGRKVESKLLSILPLPTIG
ncbi:MAG: hypothetical protein AAB705_01435 [Patescibacteria group bacterium]